jgi:MFS family permease
MVQKKKIFYGWFLCAASMLMLIGGTGIVVNSASQFLKPVSEALGVSRGQFSLYFTFLSISAMVLSPFVGKIYARWNPRVVTIGGGSLMALSWICLSWVKDITLFYLLGLFIGIGSTLSGMIAVSVLMNNWFHTRKGTAVGIAVTGSGIGSMIFNPVASQLIVAFGYQAAYRWLGLCSLLCLLPLALLYRFKPENIGMKPHGAEMEEAEGQHPAAEEMGVMQKDAMKTPAMWGVCFMAFGLSASAQGIFSQIMPYFTDIGYQQASAAMFVSLISLSMAFSKILFGWLNDRLGTRRNFPLMLVLSIAGIILLNFAQNGMAVYAAVILYGCAMAATFVMAPLITIYTFGPRDFANIYSFVTFFISVGPAVGSPLSGLIYDRNGSYQLAFMIYAILLLAVLVVGLIVFRNGGYKAEKQNGKITGKQV